VSLFQRGDIWWYEFWFAGRRIRESSKSESKTVAKSAEKNRRRELEEGFNNVSDVRRERVRAMGEIADEFLEDYKLRLPQSATFAEYAIGHIKRLLGDRMLVDVNEACVIRYQNDRLTERAAPKTVNEEVGFLLRIMGDLGDVLRVRLKKKKKLKLKVRNDIGKAYTAEEKERMLDQAANARSPHIYLALTLALNAGVRDAELRGLTWDQIKFAKGYLVVGQSKTEAGEGRTIPLNSSLLPVLREYAVWYKEKFGATRPEWYVFPFGRPRPTDPTRPITTFKTAWRNVRKNAKVTGRWHDNRHTLITDLAESGAGDQTIMDIAGHVSKRMLRHYSHIRMEAKRTALESIVNKQANVGRVQSGNSESVGSADCVGYPHWPGGLKNVSGGSSNPKPDCSELPATAHDFEGEYPQKSPQSANLDAHRGMLRSRKSKKIIGSSGRTRTYNPSVNSRNLFRPGFTESIRFRVALQVAPEQYVPANICKCDSCRLYT
jgi:integrase